MINLFVFVILRPKTELRITPQASLHNFDPVLAGLHRVSDLSVSACINFNILWAAFLQ